MDPLRDNPGLSARREREFMHRYHDILKIFSAIVNDDSRIFENAILYFIQLTEDLVNLI